MWPTSSPSSPPPRSRPRKAPSTRSSPSCGARNCWITNGWSPTKVRRAMITGSRRRAPRGSKTSPPIGVTSTALWKIWGVKIMERVVTINLNGNPYQLEEPAYDAVRAYLTRAEAALADNPDKAEVVRDLEQAIAEKCGSYLSPVKSVIAASEMTKILEEMGPVEGEASSDNAQSAGSSGSRPKKLYRIREGAQIAGVCAGLGAYFDIDVNWMRVLFLVATVLTSGFFIFVYIAMMFIIPSANTSEEWAAAHGVPFNAQEVIDRAKREYQHFAANGPPWTWPRWQRRQWKREMRARWRNYRWGGWAPYTAAAAPAPGPVSYSLGLLTGL